MRISSFRFGNTKHDSFPGDCLWASRKKGDSGGSAWVQSPFQCGHDEGSGSEGPQGRKTTSQKTEASVRLALVTLESLSAPIRRSLCRGVLAPATRWLLLQGVELEGSGGGNPTSHRPFLRRAAWRRSQASRKPGPSPLPVLASWKGKIRRKRPRAKGVAAQRHRWVGLG